jgi:hypothetical protein
MKRQDTLRQHGVGFHVSGTEVKFDVHVASATSNNSLLLAEQASIAAEISRGCLIIFCKGIIKQRVPV